ncbi:MAG: DUF1638 domain-containing protein [Anaerolineales bacterium]|nr:DUF1638 domain-containing protein [Anaerolineales bacterium]
MSRRFQLIACEINQREVCAAIARAPNIIQPVFLPKGLHDVGRERMSALLQQAVDSSPGEGCQAILLWYGLCNNGVCGVRAPLPLILPRAHDCITLMLGSRERYADYFHDNPGTFFKSPGWIERDSNPNDNPASVTARLNLGGGFGQLSARFGEENAEYLAPVISDWFKHYRKLAFINTGVGDVEAYRRISQTLAAERGWTYEEVQGDSGLLDRMLAGNWDDSEFLTVPPGRTAKPSYGPDILAID